MTVREALSKTKAINYPVHGHPVDETVAGALKARLAVNAKVIPTSEPTGSEPAGVIRVSLIDEKFGDTPIRYGYSFPQDKDWMFLRITSSGGGELMTSRAHLLYGLLCRFQEEWIDQNVESFSNGWMGIVSFRWLRSFSDMFFTQKARTVRKFNREEYVRELARLGFSHVEVNGLASLFAFETGPPGEVYPRFYTSCPALDQFVESRLNKGTYPTEYLQANLNFLKHNAALALKYGLTPGLLCFEPRSVPESLFERYPMLRGARVDHPFRSWKPRYTLSLAHPVVQEHYTELMHNLMKEVPELGYIAIVTNDSGAGFEYTNSLYPGRNGGAYLIREWKSHDEIAEAAGQNVIRFLHLLKDAAAEVNPNFRVMINLGPFSAERSVIMRGLGDRIDIMTSVAAAIDEKQRGSMEELYEKGTFFHVSRPHGVGSFNPLLGIPFPWLTYEELQAATSAGFDKLSCGGGINPPSLVPWRINEEVLKAFQFDNSINVDRVIGDVARRWVGPEWAGKLVQAWRLAEEAIRAYPPLFLYSSCSVWYRLWVRPLVPDIEKISEADREYYEKFMLTTPNNPTRVDLNADCLWTLIPPDEALKIVEHCDANVWKPLEQALDLLATAIAELPKESRARSVFEDQRDRLRALRCWLRTQRNTAAWIAGVHGYLEAIDDATRRARRELVRDMVLQEIQNTQDLLELWKASPVEFMIVSAVGETTFVYGENFGDLLQRKIELMKGREDDEPYIDPDFMWRVPGYEMKTILF